MEYEIQLNSRYSMASQSSHIFVPRPSFGRLVREECVTSIGELM